MDKEKENTHLLRWRLARSYTPEEYLSAIELTGMWNAKLQEWQENVVAGPGGWVSIGPTGAGTNGNGRVSSVLIRPTDGVNYDIYLGASSGGIWRRSSSGTSWTVLGDSLPNLHIGGLWVDPVNSNNMVVGTGNKRENGSGFYWTNNGGTVWNLATITGGAPIPGRIYRIVYNTGSPSTLVAATDQGMYRSTDAGQTWGRQFTGNFLDVAIDGGTATTLYACRVGNSPGVYKSTNFGSTWPTVYNNGTDPDIPVDADFDLAAIGTCIGVSGAVALLVGESNRIRAVLRTTDGGTSWANVTGNISVDQSQFWHARAVTMRPNNSNEIYVGSVGLYRTTNANVTSPTWTGIDGGHADVADLYFHSFSGDGWLFICNDGGLYRRDIVGSTTSNFNGTATFGLRISEMYHHDSERSLIIGSLQDNAIIRSTDYGGTWTYHSCCDGMYAEIVDNYGNDAYVGASSIPGCCAFIDHLLPNGVTVNMSVPGTADVGVLWFDRLENRLYCQRADTGGDFVMSQPLPASPAAWTTELSGLGDMRGMDGSYLDGAIYVNYWSGNLLGVATPSGASWTFITRSYAGVNGLPNTVYPSLERSGQAWIGFDGNPGEVKIVRHDDYSGNYTDITSNLNSIRKINALLAKPFDQQELYAATDIGVFQSTDGGQNWNPFQTGLPIVEVKHIRLIKRTTGTDTLVISTWGRGVWRRDISGRPLTYIDGRNTSGVEDGTIEHTYNTLSEGITNVHAGGTLALHAGNYPLPFGNTIDRAMVLAAYDGTAQIGN